MKEERRNNSESFRGFTDILYIPDRLGSIGGTTYSQQRCLPAVILVARFTLNFTHVTEESPR